LVGGEVVSVQLDCLMQRPLCPVNLLANGRFAAHGEVEPARNVFVNFFDHYDPCPSEEDSRLEKIEQRQFRVFVNQFANPLTCLSASVFGEVKQDQLLNGREEIWGNGERLLERATCVIGLILEQQNCSEVKRRFGIIRKNLVHAAVSGCS